MLARVGQVGPRSMSGRVVEVRVRVDACVPCCCGTCCIVDMRVGPCWVALRSVLTRVGRVCRRFVSGRVA